MFMFVEPVEPATVWVRYS